MRRHRQCGDIKTTTITNSQSKPCLVASHSTKPNQTEKNLLIFILVSSFFPLSYHTNNGAYLGATLKYEVSTDTQTETQNEIHSISARPLINGNVRCSMLLNDFLCLFL